jgi:protein TonB
MMIRTAGGPGLISPIDYAERRRPMPRWMVLAVGGSILAHGLIGVVLYTQRFELAAPPDDNA